MIYFKQSDMDIMNNKIIRYKKIIYISIPLFILLTTIILLLRTIITNEFSLWLEIILTTFYFSFILLIIQYINNTKDILELYNTIGRKSTKIHCYVKDIFEFQTINKLLFKKVKVETADGEKILFLYNEFIPQFNIGDTVELIVCKNIIKESYNEKITS